MIQTIIPIVYLSDPTIYWHCETFASQPSSTKALVHYERDIRTHGYSHCNNIVVQKCRYPNPNEARSSFRSHKSIRTNRLHLLQGSKTGLPNTERLYSCVIYEQLNLRFHYEIFASCWSRVCDAWGCIIIWTDFGLNVWFVDEAFIFWCIENKLKRFLVMIVNGFYSFCMYTLEGLFYTKRHETASCISYFNSNKGVDGIFF